MMGIETIRQINAEAARRARARRVKPLVMTQKLIDAFQAGERPKVIPNVGDDRPKGFKLVDTLFVDSSGLGSESEPALTQKQFFGKLEVGKAYAVISSGQFQVHVGVFEVAVRSIPPRK